MKRLMNSLFPALGAFMCLMLLSACDTVLQYPDDGAIEPPCTEREVTLRVTADISFAMLGEFEYDHYEGSLKGPGRNGLLDNGTKPHRLRFTLKAFDPSDKSPSPRPVHETVVTKEGFLEEEEVVKVTLPPGDYRIVIWADYVDINSVSDKYYDTSDFAEIILDDSEGHQGSNIYRDAFYGETSLKVPECGYGDVMADIVLERPLAKYTFESNDLREFMEEELSRRRMIEPQSGLKAPELSDYRVRMVYTRYMPCAFNVHTGKPADSRLGVEYSSSVSITADDRAQLAFDYVFTNGSETSIPVAMEVIYRDGTVVSRIPSFDVPLKRGHHTIITGNFLTTKSGGEIGVNPDFNGDYNVEIR